MGEIAKPVDASLAFDNVQMGQTLSCDIGIQALVIAFETVVNMTIEDSARTDVQQLLAQPLALAKVLDAVIRGLFFYRTQVCDWPVTEDHVVTNTGVILQRWKLPQ